MPSSVSTVDLVEQTITDVLSFDLPTIDDDSMSSQLAKILMYNHEAGGQTDNYTLHAKGDGWEMLLDNIALGSLTLVNSYPFVYKQASGDVIQFENYYGDAKGSTIPVRITFENGDSSFDGVVDVADLQTTINYMFDNLTETDCFNFTAADLWKDEKINAQDVVKEVDLLLAQDATSSVRRNAPRRVLRRDSDSQAGLMWTGGELMLVSDAPVAALDITVRADAPTDWTALKRLGFAVTTHTAGDITHVIAYSLTGAEVPAGSTAIASTAAGAPTVVAATLTDRAARTVGVTLNAGITTAVGSMAEAGDSWRLVTPQGIVVAQGKGAAALRRAAAVRPAEILLLQIRRADGRWSNTQKITTK